MRYAHKKSVELLVFIGFLRSSTTCAIQLQHISPRRNVKAVAWVWIAVLKSVEVFRKPDLSYSLFSIL